MKEKIIVITVYMAVFLLVTGLIVGMNSYFNNIFKFDFSPAASHGNNLPPALRVDLEKIHNSLEKKLRHELLDTLKEMAKKDTTKDEAVTVIDSTVFDTLNNLKEAIQRLEEKNRQNKIVKAENEEENKEKEAYQAWLKKTSSLYESMEANQAAKIISKYSDNVARDIIYTMKKKQAAEILAALNADVANRITRVKE